MRTGWQAYCDPHVLARRLFDPPPRFRNLIFLGFSFAGRHAGPRAHCRNFGGRAARVPFRCGLRLCRRDARRHSDWPLIGLGALILAAVGAAAGALGQRIESERIPVVLLFNVAGAALT